MIDRCYCYIYVSARYWIQIIYKHYNRYYLKTTHTIVCYYRLSIYLNNAATEKNLHMADTDVYLNVVV